MQVSNERLESQVDAWNSKHAVGCAVVVTKDCGEQFHTRTRSEAQVLSGHTAVILVEGIAGCYSLDRVKAKPAAGAGDATAAFNGCDGSTLPGGKK